MRDDLRQLFKVIHRRDEYASETTFRRALERVRDQLVRDATRRCPQRREAQNLAKRFRENADSYFLAAAAFAASMGANAWSESNSAMSLVE